MKRRHFRLIALLCLMLFASGNLGGCTTEKPNGSMGNPPISNGGTVDSATDDETESENGGDSSIDNPFSGGLVNGGNYEGN